jgi:PAS domain S-box-containing protein
MQYCKIRNGRFKSFAFNHAVCYNKLTGEKEEGYIVKLNDRLNLAHTLGESILNIIKDNRDNGSDLTLIKIENYILDFLSPLVCDVYDNIDFKEIVEHLDDNIFITDGNAKVLYVNPAYERNTGIKATDVVNRTVPDILKEGTLFRGGVTLDVLKRKEKVSKLSTTYVTGKEEWGYATGVPVFDDGGNIKRVVISSRKIESFTALQEDYERFVQEVKRTRVQPNVRILKNSDTDAIPDLMIGSSETLSNIWSIINKAADTDATILITGESGVGKELVANEIYKLSQRKNKPFIKINCAAIPSNLLESELFGYEKGSFSGADSKGKPGLFELANNGTLMLDEIGDMPLDLQCKLLRAIQNREIFHVGGITPIKLDIRIIVSTNADLRAKINDGSFRKDLYYRLSTIPIHIPPLRERTEDIPELCEYFLDIFIKKYNRTITLNNSHYSLLKLYDWPGNIRELENVIEYLVICHSGSGEIGNEVIPNILKMHSAEQPLMTFGLNEAVEAYEKDLIQKVLNNCKNLKEVGQILNVDASTISRKIKQYGISYHHSGIKST